METVGLATVQDFDRNDHGAEQVHELGGRIDLTRREQDPGGRLAYAEQEALQLQVEHFDGCFEVENEIYKRKYEWHNIYNKRVYGF